MQKVNVAEIDEVAWQIGDGTYRGFGITYTRNWGATQTHLLSGSAIRLTSKSSAFLPAMDRLSSLALRRA